MKFFELFSDCLPVEGPGTFLTFHTGVNTVRFTHSDVLRGFIETKTVTVQYGLVLTGTFSASQATFSQTVFVI